MLSRRYLLDTAPVRVEKSRLVVGFDPEFAKEQERIDGSRAKLVLAKAAERYLGRLLSVVFEPLKVTEKRLLPADHPVTEKKSEPEQELTGTAKWYANPVVKTVVEAFNGEITDIRE